jgi:hypothetical protein
MTISLAEICADSDDAMICAGYMRIATFKNREAFEASDLRPAVEGPFRATELNELDGYDNFTIWADDPQFHR